MTSAKYVPVGHTGTVAAILLRSWIPFAPGTAKIMASQLTSGYGLAFIISHRNPKTPIQSTVERQGVVLHPDIIAGTKWTATDII